MNGFISDIQRFSVGDGPGIRTTVFFQGCNLHCPWCHNPETQPRKAVLMYYSMLCTGCGGCAEVCPTGAQQFSPLHTLERSKCVMCGECVQACPSNALKLSGRIVNVDEVMRNIREDISFYKSSNGGVTLSGGEPLLQPEFAAAIASACASENINVIVDTAGNVDFTAFELLLPYTDRFNFDIKLVGDTCSIFGGKSDLICDNLAKLTRLSNVTVRVPVIPGINFDEKQCTLIAQMVLNVGASSVELLPFHRLCSGKYDALGIDFEFADISPLGPKQLEPLKTVFERVGLSCSIDG